MVPFRAPASRALLAAAALLFAPAAPAALQLRIAETDPPSPAVLARDEPFYVRIEFSGDEPVSLWARPYFRGKPVAKVKFNPSRQHSGTGSAMGWFSLDGADTVDEVRVFAGGGKPFREWEALAHPVEVRGTGVPGAGRPRVAWVDRMQREADALHRAELQRQAAEPPSAFDGLILTGFMLAVVGLLAGSIAGAAWALWKWRGAWRIAAAIPLAVMAAVIARIVVDTARDPTSHNLWPFEILMSGAGCVAAIAVLALVKALMRR